MQAAGLPAGRFEEIRCHETEFRTRLGETGFGAVVLDYDGTVVDTRARRYPPTASVIDVLVRLLEHGILLAIATGRGDSVGDVLRSVLPPSLWEHVVIGYYNGAVCLPLESALEKEAIREDPGLTALLQETVRNPRVAEWIADVKSQRAQLSLTPVRGLGLNALRVAVLEAAARLELVGYSVLNSSHSVDVLAPGVSKLNVVESLRNRRAPPLGSPLCIGDSGGWPGNDYDLLSTPHALSVQHVSTRLDTCWNLLPAGCSGPPGLRFYLLAAKLSGGGLFKLELDHPI